MNDRSKFLLKNLGILTVSNFASKILVFLLVPIYTTVLSTSEYGMFDLAVSTATLLYPLLTLNIVDAVMRFTMDKDSSKEDIANIGLKITIVSCFIAGLILLFFHIYHIWDDIYGLELLIFLYYISYAFNQLFIQLAKGLERVKEMAIAGVLGTLAMITTNIVFLLVLGLGLRGFFIANIISQLIPVSYFIFSLQAWRCVSLGGMDTTLLHNMLIYCIPLVASVLGWWVNSTSDKYVVTFMCGIAANGLLSVSYKIPQIITTLQNIFIQAWQISAIKEYGDGDTAGFYGQTFAVINLLMCMACSCLILLTKPISALLFANDFYEAWRYVPFLLISCVFNCASGLLGPILSAKKDSKAMMRSAAFGACINFALNVVLIYLWGIQGATIATAFSSFIIYYVRKRAVGLDIKLEGHSVIILSWILLCVQATIEIFCISIWWQVLLMSFFVIINRRKVLAISISFKNTLFRKKKGK